MVGFGMVLGGAMKGAGAGIVEQARARREEKLKMLEMQTTDRRLSEERDFRSSEAQKARDAQVEYGTAADGSTMAIRADKATPVLGPDNKPVNLATTKAGDSSTSEMKNVRFLVEEGIAKDSKEAWELIRRSRENPEATRAAIFKQWMTTLKPEFGSPDGNKIQEEAARLTDETMRVIEGGGAPSSPSGPSAAEPLPLPAPRDPAKRKIGEVYLSPNGTKGRWTEDGWEVVE